MISIITINYNNAHGLNETIQSVVSQSYFDKIEYIIVDANSNDGSVDIIKQYEHQISYWVSEPDSGIYNAMNKGVKHASGEYCLFLNSGDTLINETAIERALSYIWTADIISCDLKKDGSRFHNYQKAPDAVSILYFVHHSLPHPSTFIKTELLRCYPYDENYRIVSDWIFFFDRLGMERCSYQHLPMILSFFRTNGISSMQYDKNMDERRHFLCSRLPETIVDDLTRSSLYSVYLYYIDTLDRRSKSVLDYFFYKIMKVDYKIVKSLSSIYHIFGVRKY